MLLKKNTLRKLGINTLCEKNTNPNSIIDIDHGLLGGLKENPILKQGVWFHPQWPGLLQSFNAGGARSIYSGAEGIFLKRSLGKIYWLPTWRIIPGLVSG